MSSLLKKPSAWVPMVMSGAALTLVLSHVAIFGIPREPAADEGTAAHLFQILMGGQAPIMAYFAVRWLPKFPKQALQVLALQIVFALLAFAPVFLLEM